MSFPDIYFSDALAVNINEDHTKISILTYRVVLEKGLLTYFASGVLSLFGPLRPHWHPLILHHSPSLLRDLRILTIRLYFWLLAMEEIREQSSKKASLDPVSCRNLQIDLSVGKLKSLEWIYLRRFSLLSFQWCLLQKQKDITSEISLQRPKFQVEASKGLTSLRFF